MHSFDKMKKLTLKEDFVFLQRQMFILTATLTYMTQNIGDYYDGFWRELKILKNDLKKLRLLIDRKLPEFKISKLSYEFDHDFSYKIEKLIQTQDKFSEQVYGHLACYRNSPNKLTKHFKSEARKHNVKLFI